MTLVEYIAHALWKRTPAGFQAQPDEWPRMPPAVRAEFITDAETALKAYDDFYQPPLPTNEDQTT